MGGNTLNKLNHITLIAFLGLLLSCTNGATVASHGVSSNSSTLSTGGDSITGASAPTITRVIIDPVNPGTFDLQGDGSNSIGNACVASGTTTSTTNLQGTGTSTCQCYFQWTLASGQTGTAYVDTSYFESNMVRCPYTTVPTDLQIPANGVATISVSLYETTNSALSTPAIAVPISGPTSAFDLTNANNFAQMQRYQCKDVVTIWSPWSGSGSATAGANAVYDPFQSEDPEMSYPLNFYTGNFGAAFSYFSSGPTSSLTNWNCPSVPNDPNVAGLDLRVWSVGPDTEGSEQIYPPTGSAFDRSTFYVAKQAAAPFTVPLDTYIAPTLFGSPGGTGNSAPSGYGAQPTLLAVASDGTQGETCGDSSTQIPAGYQWAKLWLFRADLAHRFYHTSAPISGVNIGCNPGTDSAGAAAFPFCYGSASPLGGITAINSTAANPLADRILANEGSTASGGFMCINFDGTFGGGAYSGCVSGHEAPGCQTGTETNAQFGAGTDHYTPPLAAGVSNPTAYQGTGLSDPLNILTAATGQYVPKDLSPTSTDLDANTDGTVNARYDFLYVVTPVTVMAYQMENTSSTANYPYTPYRFPSKQDCQSSNPNAPAFSGDCNPSKIIHYGLKLHDISTNGDPGNTTTNLVYPMCVLQPL
jgi:hypothetical protein